MLDVNKVKEEAEKEIREEQMEKAKRSIKELLRKKAAAKNVLDNIEREIADAYAELGKGLSV